MRDTYKDFENLGCKVLGISTDSPFALNAWAKQEKFEFPLLSDYNRDVSAAYDSLYEEMMGFKKVNKRTAYIVDRDGKIQYVWCVEGKLPDFKEIKDKLKQIP